MRFRYDYSGGLKQTAGRRGRTFRNRCRPYDGPKLVWLVAACKAPDGSYWALQRWQRLLPMRGVDPVPPRPGRVRAPCLALVGPLPVLEVSPNWTYGGRWQGLFGRLTYLGQPVVRLPDAVVAAARPLRALLLRRHVQLGVRGRLEARRRQGRAQPQRRLLLQLRAPETPPGYPTTGSAAAGERRAAPRHGDGPGRDAGACSGRARASAATTRSRMRTSTRCSTGSSGRTTGCARPSGSGAGRC